MSGDSGFRPGSAVRLAAVVSRLPVGEVVGIDLVHFAYHGAGEMAPATPHGSPDEINLATSTPILRGVVSKLKWITPTPDHLGQKVEVEGTVLSSERGDAEPWLTVRLYGEGHLVGGPARYAIRVGNGT